MTTTNIDGAVAKLKIVAAKKGKKTPYAGKEARKSKLPIPPRPAAQQAASAARKPDIDDVPEFLKVENRVPLAPEQKTKIDAILASARTPSVKQDALREKQKEVKTEKSRVRIEKLKADKDGASAAMPLTGKAALRAIADTAAKTLPVTKVPAGATAAKPGKAAEKAKDAPKATAASVAKGEAKKPTSSHANGQRKPTKLSMIGELLRRKAGCTVPEVLAVTGWTKVGMPSVAKALGVKLRIETDKSGVNRYFAA